MNKAELVNRVAETTRLPKGVTKNILEKFLEAVGETLSAGNNIEIRGFGSFKVKKRKKQIARNPRTGEKVIVPSRFVPTFKPSRQLLDKVSKKS
ncbi:MAG TPA: HU family DNA-binding protein [archaeon]|nr:HU family DNA-binding protein [archaeon]